MGAILRSDRKRMHTRPLCPRQQVEAKRQHGDRYQTGDQDALEQPDDAASGAEVEQLTMQIRRRMPPGQSQLAGVKPGEEESVEVVFNRPWMPEAKPASYRVRAEGTLKGAWDKGKEEVSDDETNEYTESPLAGKTFVTNEVVLVVE